MVKDVENYDPILNPVLNREVRNTAGRVLITIGDQDIDLSPAFNLILITRDSSVSFCHVFILLIILILGTISTGYLLTSHFCQLHNHARQSRASMFESGVAQRATRRGQKTK